MLAWFRKLLSNWIARVFFGALVVVFVFWGISNVVTLVSSSTTIARVGGKPVDISAVQAEFQNELSQAEQKGPVDPATRQQIAQSALATVLRQRVLAAVEAQLGIVAPDAAVRAQIDQIPQFQTNGAFDQAKFDQVLLQNNLSPDRFIGDLQANIANQQLVQGLTGGVTPPLPLVGQIFDFVAQARIAETVDVATAAQKAPPAPSAAVLQRYWKNHPAKYTAPEYRTIKLVILSPSVLAPSEPVSDAELQAAYQRVAETEKVPASRSVEVVTSADQAKAAKLAQDWKSGASWTQIQAEAAKLGASAVELDHAQENQFPSQPLANAVFAARPDVVTGPVAGAFGFFVIDVTDAVAAGAPSFDSVKAQLKQQLQLQKAQAEVNQNVDGVQDALAGQTPLDQLPANLGLAAVEGTLDAQGDTLDGTKAPIPGGDALRDAVVKAVFAAHIGDPPELTSGPANSYFAFTLDKIIPPMTKPFADVQAQVAADWQADELSREAQVKAADLLHAVQTGQSLDEAASAAGLSVTMTAPITRGAQPPAGVPAGLVQQLFGMQTGQPTMAPSADGFMVAVLSKIEQPPQSAAPQLVASIQDALTKGLQSDVVESFLNGLQGREHISIDQKLIAQIAQ
jgi:peptidyl-prolyl cis-trans isomerase D